MITISAFFTNQGLPLTNGNPSLNIISTTGTILVQNAMMTNVNSTGWYIYNFTPAQGFFLGVQYLYNIDGGPGLNYGERFKFGSVMQDSPDRTYANVVANGGNTVNTFQTNLTGTTTNLYINSLLLFTTGSQALTTPQQVTAFNFSTGFITVTPGLPLVPSGTDQFMLIDF